ncbi:MAG: glycerophosphodiester phosphodiesterase [Deltaproteobacteria bacterium]|nr:MAG: glycerophosphodiester phosphodiesterase [Deltaproteobacteria bacterium]
MYTKLRRHRRSLAAIVIAMLGLGTSVLRSGAQADPDRGRHGDRDCPRAGKLLVLGHRGAAGYRPEHTLASYQLAIDLGADFIEPDLVSTRDGHLVARHENDISGTTDIASHPEFASRKATKVIDGVTITGWFTEDFTLAELKTLRARERLPALRPQNATFDGQFEIPTFEEVIALAQREGGRRHRVIGIYPETKHPTYFQGIGLSLEEPLIRTLEATGLGGKRDAVFIQSFEVANLQKLRRMTRLPLIQLIDATGKPFDFVVAGDPRTYADLVTPAGLHDVARYADGIGVNKNLIIPRDATGKLLAPTTLIADAHAEHLQVHAWTFRAENSFLPRDFQIGDPANPLFAGLRGDFPAELKLFFGLGLDAAFTDQSDVAVGVRTGLPPCDTH